METRREKFKRLVNELTNLGQYESDDQSFLEKHYKKIESLLELTEFENDASHKHYFENKYVRFRKKYLKFWYRKLQPYRLAQCSKQTAEELRVGREHFKEFSQIIRKLPSLRQVLGTNTIAFLRSNQYAVEALILMKEKGNVQQILENWHKAGKACKIPKKKHKLTEDCHLLAQGENCFSEQYKRRAFHSIQNQPANYAKIIDNLRKASEHAKRALNLYEEAGDKNLESNTNKHIAYINYWRHVFEAREFLLEKKFEKATSAIREAIKEANIIDPKAKKIFPNCFRDFDDLKNEQFFIQACEALSKLDLISCKGYLEAWGKNSEEIRGTWRYLNIDLRKEAVQCLIFRYAKDEYAYRNSVAELRERINAKPQVGKHTRSIIRIIEKDFPAHEEACGELFNVFPLHTYPPSTYEDKWFQPTQEEKLRQLPLYYKTWLSTGNIYKLNEQKAFLTIDYIFLCYLRTVIEHCYHYVSLLTEYGRLNKCLPEEVYDNFDKLGWEEVYGHIECLLGVLENRTKGKCLNKLSGCIKSYQEKASVIRRRLFESGTLEKKWDKLYLRDLARNVLNILTETGWQLFPHPVKIKKVVEKSTSGEIIYTLERIWGKDEKEMDLSLEISQTRLQKNKFYFLGHRWKWKDYDFIEYRPRKDENFGREIIPTVSFGRPHKGCVLLYEGKTDGIVLRKLMDHLYPYWTALDIILAEGGGDRTYRLYNQYRDEGRYVVAIADKDVEHRPAKIKNWKNILINKKNTFIMEPDLEGMNLEYLRNAINGIYPELEIDIEELGEIIKNRIEEDGWEKWGGTINAVKKYLNTILSTEERPKYNVDKTSLAPLLAKEMVEKSTPHKIEEALNRLLNLAEGRAEYE